MTVLFFLFVNVKSTQVYCFVCVCYFPPLLCNHLWWNMWRLTMANWQQRTRTANEVDWLLKLLEAVGNEAAETAELATSLTFVGSPTLTWIAAAASSPAHLGLTHTISNCAETHTHNSSCAPKSNFQWLSRLNRDRNSSIRNRPLSDQLFMRFEKPQLALPLTSISKQFSSFT